MKKKLLCVLLIITVISNFICISSHAEDSQPSIFRYGDNSVVSNTAVESVMEEGRDSSGQSFTFDNFGESIMGMIMQYIALIFNNFPMVIQGLMSMLAKNPETSLMQETSFKGTIFGDVDAPYINIDTMFTVERTVFNEVSLFNADIFDLGDSYTVGTGENEKTIIQSGPLKLLKDSAAGWFYTCRLLAMMINLAILIYVGIRMALSTIASEEARYKKMLTSWLESMIILFLLHYIMAFTIQLGEAVLNIIYTLRANLYANGEEGFETIIMSKIYYAFAETSGMEVFLYSLFFWFITVIQAKFFLTYFKRLLSIMFLAIISPFITVTYPIDKMGDGKAQAFEAWMKEFIINVAMQPIHAAIYLVFVFTAGKIAAEAPFVSMIFLLCLGRIENIVRNVFGITSSVTMKNFDTELKHGGKGK